MSVSDYPTVSILIPTLNAQKFLDLCLSSIANQDYPQEKIEIIIADGGSKDQTLAIAKKSGAKIYENPLKTGESGKAVALKHARGEIVALIDSDNILPGKNWLKNMIEPFSDLEIVGSEPWEFTYRKSDGFIDRYCALLGMNDPLCYFLGNYDRVNTLTGKWTSLPVDQEDKGGWLKVTLKPEAIPTIGANGTFFRRSNLIEGLTPQKNRDYLFDIDILASLAAQKPVNFAKVKIGIIHLYCGSSIVKFIRKQKRRVRDYLYYQRIGVRSYPWQTQNKLDLLKFIISCLTVAPLFYQSVKGYINKPDVAWFFHPLSCWITFWVYSWEFFFGAFRIQSINRQDWRQ